MSVLQGTESVPSVTGEEEYSYYNVSLSSYINLYACTVRVDTI